MKESWNVNFLDSWNVRSETSVFFQSIPPLTHLPPAVLEMGSVASLRGYVLINIVEEHGDRVMAPNLGLLLLFHKKSEGFFFFFFLE